MLRAWSVLVAVIFAFTVRGDASANHYTNWMNIWAPFSGIWNPFDDDDVDPENHHTPWGGDWATDYYKTPGNTGYLGVTNSNSGTAYGYIYDGGNDQSSCDEWWDWAGYAITIQIYDDYLNRGWLVYAHVDATDSLNSSYFVPEETQLYPWYFVGRTKQWTNSDCWQVTTSSGVHWHVEMNNSGTHNACYSYEQQVNLSLTTGDTLGAVGSNASWSPPYCGGP